MRKLLSLGCLTFSWIGLISSPVLATQSVGGRSSARAELHSPELRSVAGRVGAGESLIIGAVEIEAGESPGDLVLERFEVFRPDAEIVIHSPHGELRQAAPQNLYFRGYVEGHPDSQAVVTVREHGGVRGVVRKGGDLFILSDERDQRAGGVMTMRALTAGELDRNAAPFACGADQIGETPKTLSQMLPPPSAEQRVVAAMGGASYGATIAIETDYEFYQLFGNSTDAADYVADLIGYISTFYEAEIDTQLVLGEVSLWTFSGDPWGQTSTLCGLLEFGRYWNDNQGGIERSLAHFMSGKNNGGGVAWLNVLCDSAFNYNHHGSCPGLSPQTDNYGGDYGYSGTMDGDFDVNNPGVLWDVVVVAHELGHNFGSPHTHCYGGLGGNANPIDSCYTGECGGSGCACGAQSLPSGCPGNGQGCGTIMSYCHLLSGGMSNIGLTFGDGHPYGIAPGRVATRMSDYVIATANSNPSCLAPSNQAPNAVDDDYSVDEGDVLSVSAPGVLDNDTDPEGDSLTASVVSNPSDGDLTLNSNGSFTYTPDGGFSGTDTFTYRAKDGSNNTDTATVTIEVVPNTPPVAVADSYDTEEGIQITVTAPGVLGNDTDADGDSLTAAVQADPANGTLTLAPNGTFTYKPNANFFGTDSFTYRANDGIDNSNTATVTIDVEENNEPVAVNDDYDVEEGARLTIALPGVLSNDTDLDGEALSAALHSAPTDGTLTLNADGSFVYEPSVGFVGSDSFKYWASDGVDVSNVATVSIDVSECLLDDNLALESMTVSTTEAYSACYELTAGPSFRVTETGDVTLLGATVVLNDGFVVSDGGVLAVHSR